MFGWTSENAEQLESNCPEPELTPAKALLTTRYDVVRLENSLEYSENPFTFLKKVEEVIQKNGLLVISAPDSRGWNFQLYGEGATLLDADLPSWFFTPTTLSQLLVQCGFRILRVSTFAGKKFLPANLFTDSIPLNGENDHFASDRALLPELHEENYFRIFARPDEKRMFKAMRMQEKESMPAEASENFESLFVAMAD
ncbi:MAG: hypothetical protein GY852_02670 [bacterium]|nr:hypothetical protein [bacterium]